jgi:hypothetical protein
MDTIAYYYVVHLKNGNRITFVVPISDMGEAKFDEEIFAKLLIRYIKGWTL